MNTVHFSTVLTDVRFIFFFLKKTVVYAVKEKKKKRSGKHEPLTSTSCRFGVRKVLALISCSALFKLFWPKQCHRKGPIVTHSLLYKIQSIFQKAIRRAAVPCYSENRALSGLLDLVLN